MTAWSYLYVVLGVAFIGAAALVVKTGADPGSARPAVTAVHERAVGLGNSVIRTQAPPDQGETQWRGREQSARR